MSWGTVDAIEVVWTLAALPGLIIWWANRLTAGRTLRAVSKLGLGNGRLVWSKFSVLLTNVFVSVQLVFVLIGVASMLRIAPPSTGWDWIRVALTVGLLGAPALISFVGYRWRRADRTILSMARARKRRQQNEVD